jgi:hypothetical protein
MKTLFISTILSILLLISGCNKFKSSNENKTGPTGIAPMEDRQSIPKSNDEQSNLIQLSNDKTQVSDKSTFITKRMVVKNGSMNIEIDKYDDSEKKVNEIVSRLGGYVTSSNASANASGKKQGSIAVKVPADKYDALLNDVSGLGKVIFQTINSSDITEEYIDLEARVKTQKDLEQRLTGLLSSKAGSLKDVIDIEQKLSEVRQKIESFEGRMRYLKSQSDFSSLTISLYEPSLLETSTGGGFIYEIGEAFKKGLRGFTEIFTGLIVLFIALIPILIIAIILFFIIRKIIRKRKSVNATAVTADRNI